MKVTGWTFCGNNSYQQPDSMTENESQEATDAVINEMRNKKYKFTGSSHQYQINCCPIIDNKYIYCVSMRNWRSIMQKAYNLPNENGLGYITWAWCTPDNEIEKLPKQR